MSLILQAVSSKAECRGPFLANFEQNIPPCEELGSSLEVSLLEKGRKKSILRMSDNVLEISGKGVPSSAACSTYLIGIRDDATNTMKLFPVEQVFKL